jgi:hypothetical protein
VCVKYQVAHTIHLSLEFVLAFAIGIALVVIEQIQRKRQQIIADRRKHLIQLHFGFLQPHTDVSLNLIAPCTCWLLLW